MSEAYDRMMAKALAKCWDARFVDNSTQDGPQGQLATKISPDHKNSSGLIVAQLRPGPEVIHKLYSTQQVFTAFWDDVSNRQP